MSLLSATPSTRDRTTRRGLRSDLPRPGAPRLELVRAGYRSVSSDCSGRDRRPARPTGTAPITLTRRGRIVVRIGIVGLVLLAVLAGVLLLGRPAQAGSQSHPIRASYRVVLPGETLWQIAGEVAPNADRRDTVAKIIELNALPGAGVLAGQRIAVPVPASS
jgi:LysM domain